MNLNLKSNKTEGEGGRGEAVTVNRSQRFLLFPPLPDHVYINYVACEVYTMKRRDGRDSFFADKKQFGMKRKEGEGGRKEEGPSV